MVFEYLELIYEIFEIDLEIIYNTKIYLKVISSINIRRDTGLNDADQQHNRLYQALITTYP